MKRAVLFLLLLFFAAIGIGQTKINNYEYWFDNNYAGRAIKNVTQATAYTFDSAINTNNLSAGLHSFNIRFKDNIANYSSITSAYFYKSATKLSAYEYWFDGNYNNKIGKSSTSTTINLSIDALPQTIGYHVLNIRFKDDVGIWSSVKSSYFVRSSRTLTAYEYWIDNNYANKVVQLTSSQTVNFTTPIDYNFLSDGLHQFTIRFQGESAIWSSASSTYFYKGAYSILAYEYWIDDFAHKVTQTVSSAQPTYILEIGIDPSSFSSGSHIITFRFKDKAGVWSLPTAKYFSQTPKDEDRDGLPNETETARYGTDTANFDTNNDWLADGVNVFTGLSPLSLDTDGDGVFNVQEIENGTSAILWDSDFDGVSDKTDPFPLDRFRTKLPLSSSSDHTAPVITLSEPL